VATDICGFSRLAEHDETAALATVETIFRVFNEAVDRHRGRVFNRAGDGFLAEFPSAVDGVKASMAFVADIKARNTLSPGALGANVRVGIHVGDVQAKAGGDLMGHGVNVAARLQAEAEPNGILISLSAINLVRNEIDAGFRRRGPLLLRNMSEPVVAFDVDRRPGWQVLAARLHRWVTRYRWQAGLMLLVFFSWDLPATSFRNNPRKD